jgi:DNA-binding transcriptional regulator YiaG
MGKLEQTLKSEITRLAKKQVRATCLPLARDVRQLRRTVSALRKTVAALARLGTEFQAERQAQRAKLAVASEEVKAARISPLLIKKLRSRLGITQGELATLVGVSHSAVCSWEYGKARPEGHNREALVALRRLGRREVRGILAQKLESRKEVVQPRKRPRKKQR